MLESCHWWNFTYCLPDVFCWFNNCKRLCTHFLFKLGWGGIRFEVLVLQRALHCINELKVEFRNFFKLKIVAQMMQRYSSFFIV